jgi:predicted alpha/beta-hydrolase family hydrolase
MEHHFLEDLSDALAERAVASFRYQFPYTAAGKRRPDPPALLESCVRAAVAEAARACPGLPLFAGGKSMGGRMTSQAQAKEPLPGVRGLVFFGFPLHPAGAPATKRGDHLAQTGLPLLFLQGERDKLADLSLLRPIVAALGPRATLEVVPEGDHGFAVPKRTGRSEAEVLGWLAERTRAFVEALRAPAGGAAGSAASG